MHLLLNFRFRSIRAQICYLECITVLNFIFSDFLKLSLISLKFTIRFFLLFKVWKYPSMGKVADLQAHTSRVLELMKSPDGTTIASAAGDETIRMWKLWPLQDKKALNGTTAKKAKQPMTLFSKATIR